MTIPVFINVFNRLTTTRLLVEQVAKLQDARPILIDNASNYQPLLDWYSTCPYELIRLPENAGHHAPWRHVIPAGSQFARHYGASRYVVTDCDLCLRECPPDVLSVLQEPFGWRQGIVKSGLSLRIDDLPEWQTTVSQWESRFWSTKVSGGRFFMAAIDTTFAMYDAMTPHRMATKVVGVKSVRSAPPYTARHIPWYLDASNLDDENQHYFRTANASNSWKPSGRHLDNK